MDSGSAWRRYKSTQSHSRKQGSFHLCYADHLPLENLHPEVVLRYEGGHVGSQLHAGDVAGGAGVRLVVRQHDGAAGGAPRGQCATCSLRKQRANNLVSQSGKLNIKCQDQVTAANVKARGV